MRFDLEPVKEKKKINIPIILLLAVIFGVVFAMLMQGAFSLFALVIGLLFVLIVKHWIWVIIILLGLLFIKRRFKKKR